MWVLLSLSVVGCSAVHRVDSDYVFRTDGEEPTVRLKEYKSVQQRPLQQAELALAVAISGGGYRAANFAAGILCGLEHIRWQESELNILREVDYLSTVSGGGFAAGAFISKEHAWLKRQGSLEGFSFCEAMCEKPPDAPSLQEALERDSMKSMFGLMSLAQLGMNRGEYLEMRLEDAFLGARPHAEGECLTVGDIFVPAGSPARPMLPYWVANSTVYENGAIFPHTPDIYRTYGVTEVRHRKKWMPVRGENGSYAIPLSVGMKASATYPGAVTPTTLRTSERDPKNPYLHLLDGGLIDNLGVLTAVRLLKQDDAKRKVLVVIDASTKEREPFSKGPGAPFIFKVGSRVLDISLDSWRTRYRDIIGNYARGAGVDDLRIIVLGFHDLPAELRGRVLKIKTRFNVTPEEQEDLFAAGGEIVRRNGGHIYCAAFEDGNCEKSDPPEAGEEDTASSAFRLPCLEETGGKPGNPSFWEEFTAPLP